MEMGEISKGQSPDQRVDNIRRSPMGLKRSNKIPHMEMGLGWSLNNMCTGSLKKRRHTELQNI